MHPGAKGADNVGLPQARVFVQNGQQEVLEEPMNATKFSRSLCAGVILVLALPMPLLAAAEGCEPLILSKGFEECGKLALDADRQCRAKLGLPQLPVPKSYAERISPEAYIKLAECDEAAAAKTKHKAAAEELMIFGRVNRRRAKPGVSIGMTAQQVIEDTSWGAPRDVNRTTNTAGTHEQWVYGGGRYLYFDNGTLVSIQTSSQ